MRKILVYFWMAASISLWNETVEAQSLSVDASYTPQQLISDVLIGQGVQVSNITFSGNAAARGYFDGSSSNIGLQSGVVISTGRAIDAEGPNGTPISDMGTEFNGPGDAALTALSGSPLGTFDAAVLAFDFVPSSDTVQFRYVFASNEYMLYVGTGVNDVFAFLVSGPGIVGEQNVALIPGSTTPVAIDNVNANVNSQYYIDNENPPGTSVEYNGFTQVLTAMAVLTPCETYHIRLAIADGGDWSFDSAVFLEAGSFTSPSVSLNAQPSFSASSTATELVEGCSSMTMTFERSAPYDDPLNIGLTYSGTAIVGSDITSLPTTISFASGQASTTLSFNVLEDGVPEGIENMTITVDQLNPCATGPPTSVSFTIEDAVPITLLMTPDVSFVCPQDYTIDATVSGGYPGYSYNWTGASGSGPSITVSPISSTTYTVSVTDECGFTATGSTTVSTGNYQPLQVSVEDVVVCNGDNAELEAVVSGGLGNISYLWDSGGTDSTYAFSPAASTTVTVQVTDSCGLSQETSGSVSIDQIDASFDQVLSSYDAIQFTNLTVDYEDVFWEFGDDSTGTADNPRHVYAEPGTYTVIMTVTNANGCETSVSQDVTVYPPLHVYVPNSFTPNGDGLNDFFGVVGEGYLYYDLEIYDRWGSRMLSGRFTDADAWDGTNKGKTVPSDIYLYKVFVQPPIGIEVREVGKVTVISGK